MGGTCSTRGAMRSFIQHLNRIEGRDYLDDLGIDGRTILK
jgi:hypothetical protein